VGDRRRAPGENVRLFGSDVKDFVVPGDDPAAFSKYFFNILVDFKPDESPLLHLAVLSGQ
jgi:hypothetical protein